VLTLTGVPILDTRNGVTAPRIQIAEAIALLETMTLPPDDPDDPDDTPLGVGGGGNPATTSSSSGGGSCGLIGFEPFLALGLVRLGRRKRSIDFG
jgi:hypothetical protein